MRAKFRAWNKEEKKMWNVGAIHFDEGTIDVWRIEWCENLQRDGKVSNFGMPYDRYDIEEFTGLLDKNGKEIYEGDGGVKSSNGKWVNGRYIVRFGKFMLENHELIGFYIDWLDDNGLSPSLPDWIDDWGVKFDMNIHENPELKAKP